MAVINFGNNLKLPEHLELVAQTTGNEKLDLGYQCSDMLPFWRFYSEGEDLYKYIKVNPAKVSGTVTVNVYGKAGTITRDGRTYDRMVYEGTADLSNGEFYFDSTGYVYQNVYENIRVFKVNVWSLKKPFAAPSYFPELLDDSHYQQANYGFTIPRADNYDVLVQDVDNMAWRWNIPILGTDKFRLRDFDGYDSSEKAYFAVNPIYEGLKLGLSSTFEVYKAFTFLTNFYTFTQVSSPIYIGWYCPGVGYKQMGLYTDTFNEETFRIVYDNVNFMAGSRYTFHLVATTYEGSTDWHTPDEGLDNYWWLLSPEPYVAQLAPASAAWTYVSWEIRNVQFDTAWTGEIGQGIQFDLHMTIDDDWSDVYGSFVIKVVADGKGGDIVMESARTIAMDAAGSSKDIHINYDETYTSALEAENKLRIHVYAGAVSGDNKVYTDLIDLA